VGGVKVADRRQHATIAKRSTRSLPRGPIFHRRRYRAPTRWR